MIRALDRQTPLQIRVNIDRRDPHQTHRPSGPAALSSHALAVQVMPHPPCAVERILQKQLVDSAHQRQRLRALSLRLMLERRASDQQLLRRDDLGETQRRSG